MTGDALKGLHFRSMLNIVAYQGDIPLSKPAPIDVRGFIPASVEDTADPRLRVELLELAIEGIQDLVISERQKINEPKENA